MRRSLASLASLLSKEVQMNPPRKVSRKAGIEHPERMDTGKDPEQWILTVLVGT